MSTKPLAGREGGVESGAGPPACVRCGAPYLPHGQCSRFQEGCQGGIGEYGPQFPVDNWPDDYAKHRCGHNYEIARCPYRECTARELYAALERIERWFGEFPKTDSVWPDGTEMSYGAAFGSNGERDYMRGVACTALDKARRAPKGR